MAGKKKVHRALIEGARQGLVGAGLYAFVKEKAPDVTNKKIVHTALLTLSDPQIDDRNILNVIYGLAIDYRLGADAAEATREEGGPAPAKRIRRKAKAAGPIRAQRRAS